MLYPTKSFRASRSAGDDDDRQPWEMLEAPKTPRMTGGLMSPTTPRTKAFNTLNENSTQPRQGNKGIPLRHHISMGDETYQGPKNGA